MNAEARQASLILDSVANAVANWTVDRHAAASPRITTRYGANWRSDWLGHSLAQLHMLAQAIAVRSSEIFTHSVRWSAQSFRARGMDQADLTRNLECMRDVLKEELPPPVATSSTAFVEDSIRSLVPATGVAVLGDLPDAEQKETVLRYLTAILEGNRSEAESIILAAFHGGAPIADIYEKILTPAQERLGWMWHRGDISVADEHMGSATTLSVIGQLRLHFNRSESSGRTIVATSTPGDLHEIGVRMVADLFEINGWNVVFLGANTPIDDVLELLERRNADLLALSVSTALTLRDAGDMVDAVRQKFAVPGTKVLVGGPPFKAVPDLWRELGADGYALSATEAVKLGKELVAS